MPERKKILWADDEIDLLEAHVLFLAQYGYDVVGVTNGEDALHRVLTESFDAVLMDVRLNGMSGLESLKKIKEKKPGTIVIMITGFSYDDELVAKSNELGCAGYIGKNASISQIICCFKAFIKDAKEKNKQ